MIMEYGLMVYLCNNSSLLLSPDKRLKHFISTYNKMKKQKSTITNISEISSSDDESQAKPKLDKEELKKLIKLSDDELSQEQITPKSSPQKPIKIKRQKSPRLQDLPKIQPNKSISQKITQKYLTQEADFKKLQKKAKKLGANSLDYSKRKSFKYMVEYNDKKIHFGSVKTEDYITHHDQVRREKYLNKAKRITDKDGRLTYELPFHPNYWSVNLLN